MEYCKSQSAIAINLNSRAEGGGGGGVLTPQPPSPSPPPQIRHWLDTNYPVWCRKVNLSGSESMETQKIIADSAITGHCPYLGQC